MPYDLSKLPLVDRDSPWRHRILPYYDLFRRLHRDERRFFIREAADRLDLSANTVQRQLAALMFLEAQGHDPHQIGDGFTLTALESAAKAMSVDREAGRGLLSRVLTGKLSARDAVSEYKKILAGDPGLPRWMEHNVSLPRGGNSRYSPALASINADRNVLSDSSVSVAASLKPVHRSAGVKAQSGSNQAPSPGAANSHGPTISLSYIVARLANSVHGEWGESPLTLSLDRDALAPWSSRLIPPLVRLEADNGRSASAFVFDERAQPSPNAQFAFIASIALALLTDSNVHAYYAGRQPALMDAFNSLIEKKGIRFECMPFISITRDIELHSGDSNTFPSISALLNEYQPERL